MIILGAGLAGCLAAVLNQNSTIFEPFGNKETHKAILRFRSDEIGKAVGIPFKKVKVYKGISLDGQDVPLSPRLITMYSRKVSDTLSARSITKLETVDRWVAPDNFHAMLKDMLDHRIYYNIDIESHSEFTDIQTPKISTLPLKVLSNMLGTCINTETRSSGIFVTKYKLVDCDINMTVYFPSPETMVYRASISESELIIESIYPITIKDVSTVRWAMGMMLMRPECICFNDEQLNGKISPMNEEIRKEFIYKTTVQNNIYSLGRFATWRNLIMDDVYKDIQVIKKLMNQSNYDRVIK